MRKSSVKENRASLTIQIDWKQKVHCKEYIVTIICLSYKRMKGKSRRLLKRENDWSHAYANNELLAVSRT